MNIQIFKILNPCANKSKREKVPLCHHTLDIECILISVLSVDDLLNIIDNCLIFADDMHPDLSQIFNL